jgi:uncharacterized protein YecE (DUF72 family)
MRGGGFNIFIGTSGWRYDHWRGVFYPENIKKKDWLEFYSRFFNSVEINSSFYGLPSRKTLENWRLITPLGFLFSVKASKYITHLKKLKDPDKTVPPFLEALRPLGDKLGPILFQLPPRWGFDPERLYDFLEFLPGGYDYVFEFRDSSWFESRALEALTEIGASFCIYELGGMHSPRHITSDLVYLRLHGPGAAYRGRYGRQRLAGWAGALSAWVEQGKEIFCYFDNDEAGYAALDAVDLRDMMAGE